MVFHRLKAAWLLQVVALLAGIAAAPALAKPAQPEQAQALVEKAIALYQAEGPAEAFATMNNPEGGFRNGELYVFVVSPENITVVHAADPLRVGNDTNKGMDADGRSIGHLLREAATPQGVWVDYRFKNFADGRIEPKSSWLKLVDGYIFGAGIYKQSQ